MKILLSDDSQFMRQILKDLLEKAYPDATFIEASTGVEALDLCLTEKPDLMILDLIMPEKVGVDVLKEIQGKYDGKVIVVSAMGQEQIIEEAKGLGAADFIVKPFEEKIVLETVARILG
jgi:two-component system chemotaxis response regulator CheY